MPAGFYLNDLQKLRSQIQTDQAPVAQTIQDVTALYTKAVQMGLAESVKAGLITSAQANNIQALAAATFQYGQEAERQAVRGGGGAMGDQLARLKPKIDQGEIEQAFEWSTAESILDNGAEIALEQAIKDGVIPRESNKVEVKEKVKRNIMRTYRKPKGL